MGRITLSIDGQVARLCLDNPRKRNCITEQMLVDLNTHLDVLERDTSLRICLLEAAPAGAFCTGADIGDWSALDPQAFAEDWLRRGNRIFDRLAQLRMPTLAIIEGPAMGGGLELAACCDWRIISHSATFSLPETGLGVIPGWSGTQRLSRLLPEATLKSMVLLGRTLDANTASALGFAELVDDPGSRRDALVETVCARSGDAIRVAKSMIHAAVGENPGAMIDALGGGFAASGPHKTIGVEAFRNKRKPEFD